MLKAFMCTHFIRWHVPGAELRELDLNLLPNTIIKLRFLPENEINLSHVPVNNRFIVHCDTNVSLMLYIMEISIAEVYFMCSYRCILFSCVLPLLCTSQVLYISAFVLCPLYASRARERFWVTHHYAMSKDTGSVQCWREQATVMGNMFCVLPLFRFTFVLSDTWQQ